MTSPVLYSTGVGFFFWHIILSLGVIDYDLTGNALPQHVEYIFVVFCRKFCIASTPRHNNDVYQLTLSWQLYKLT